MGAAEMCTFAASPRGRTALSHVAPAQGSTEGDVWGCLRLSKKAACLGHHSSCVPSVTEDEVSCKRFYVLGDGELPSPMEQPAIQLARAEAQVLPTTVLPAPAELRAFSLANENGGMVVSGR